MQAVKLRRPSRCFPQAPVKVHDDEKNFFRKPVHTSYGDAISHRANTIRLFANRISCFAPIRSQNKVARLPVSTNLGKSKSQGNHSYVIVWSPVACLSNVPSKY